MRELKGKVAVVTGAASGIGLAICEGFAAEGMRLILADIDQSALQQVADRFRESGCEVEPAICDVSQQEQVEGLAELAYSRFGEVNVVCNNAGVAIGGPAWSHSVKDWQWALGVNLWGVIYGINSFVPRMLEANTPGHILNTSSIAGLMTPPMMGVYCATKHAVVGLTESLYHDLATAQSKIGVSVLCPGFVSTRIHESSRNRPEDLCDPSGSAHPMAQLMKQALDKLIENGTPAKSVADAVIEAVKENRFWILTHPDLDKAVSRRHETMLARENPPTVPLL